MVQAVPFFDHRRALFIYETLGFKEGSSAFVTQKRFDLANYIALSIESYL